MSSAPNVTASPVEGRFFWNVELPTCGDLQCHSNGECVTHGETTVCECRLGYVGEFCRDTVNEALSLKLTLGTLAIILGILLAAFLFAKLRQKKKAQIRQATDKERERLKLEGEWA
ncbi:delta-like protein C [Engraulis encrasicolus]|uniref:delta-like protein C n=1 Tax=Engraulis encrasicolus TaxID=184585 RepID=UPI002FD614E9